MLTTPAGEFQPARSGNALGWEQNTRARPNQYAVMVRPDGAPAVQASRQGVSAAMGDFSEGRLIYQEYRGNPRKRGRSDLFAYDVSSGNRSKIPKVNTKQWEYWPSSSGPWLLFARWKPSTNVRRLFLVNLDTGGRRVLDKTKGRKAFVGPGQVNGNFAVWSTCRPRCNIFRYDIAAESKQMIHNPGSYQRAPSVTSGGTVYFSRGAKGCGGSVSLVRAREDGSQEVMVQLQQGLDIRDTYAYTEPNGTVEVFYERNACGTKAGSDIYKVRDLALATLSVDLEGTGTGTVTSSPPGINCGTDCSEDFERGTTVTLTPGSAQGSVFVSWGGACTGSGACQVTLDSATEVTATFLLLQSVTIIKESIPDDPQDFQFDPDAQLSPDFVLDDDPLFPSPTNQRLIPSVSPGTYEVRELPVAGWQLTDIECVGDPQYVPEVGARRVTIDLDPGEAVQCIFENTKNGQIQVSKETEPNPSNQSFTFVRSYGPNFTLDNGQTHDSGFSLSPGSYSVQENTPTGWQVTSASCDDGSLPSSISLGPGETVTCTFVNTQLGRIVAAKQTTPDGSTEDFSFSSTYGSFTLHDGQSNTSTFLSPGAYSVSEIVPAGWNLTSATCSDGSPPTSISLGAGETVTCTFNNSQDGRILVTKQTNPGGSSQTFAFNRDYGSDFSLSDGQSNDSGFTLDPGAYSVSEIVPAGWNLTSATCSDGSPPSSISLEAGETVTCTFTNTQLSGITIVKDSTPDDPQDFTFSTTGGPPLTAFALDDDPGSILSNQQQFTGLVPGTYSVSEDPDPTGWELTDITCTGGGSNTTASGRTATIGIDAGESVLCTFSNQGIGSITIMQDTVPDDAQDFEFATTGGLSPSSFSLDDDAEPTLGSQQIYTEVEAGPYTVAQTPVLQMPLSSLSCVGGGTNTSTLGSTATIGLDPDENVICTYQNTASVP